MADKTLTKLTDALVAAIDSIDKAKNHLYDDKQLEEAEKEIFEDSRLKNDDGTTPKLDEVRNTVVLLENLIKAQSKLEDEKKDDKHNLTKNGNDYLIFLMGERRNKTIAFEIVNTKKNGAVDEIIKDYQNILYRRVNRELQGKKKAVEAALFSIGKEGKAQDEEIGKINKEISEHQTEAQAIEYRDKVVAPVVNALKDDLVTGQPGNLILNEIVKTHKKIAETIYKVDTPASADNLGSIIKTAVTNPYSDKPFTHPTYLAEGLPYQMRELFQRFDQKKLFSLIEKNFSADADKIGKFKRAFKRIMSARVAPETKENFPDLFDEGNLDAAPRDKAAGDYSMVPLANLPVKDNPGHGSSAIIIPKDLDQAHEYVLNLSDVLYVMHALFPKDSDYFNSDLLKEGKNALPFTNKTLTTEYDIFWRGREDNTLGGLTYRNLFPNAVYPRDEAFDSIKLQLSWGGSRGKSIPEFFWSVYSSPKAIQWEAKKILKVDGTYEDKWNGEVAAYENQLHAWKVGSNAEVLAMAYKERFKRMVDRNTAIADRIGPLTDAQRIDLDKFWSDWEETLYDVISSAYETIHKFRKDSEVVDYLVLKNSNLALPYMIENPNATGTIDPSAKEVWNKMISEICEGKITAAKQLQAKKAVALNKRLEINGRESAKVRELRKYELQIKALSDGKRENLEAQLEQLGEKVTDSVDNTKPAEMKAITVHEVLSMEALYWLLKELAKEDGKPLDPKFARYDNNLKQWVNNRSAVMKTYDVWRKSGDDFEERLKRWQANEGKNLEEDAIKAYLEIVKEDLKKGEEFGRLSPEESADLSVINTYLTKEVVIRAKDLENVFIIDTEISQEKVEEWKNYGNKGFFKSDVTKIKEIADFVNKLSDKNSFFNDLKTYLTDKSNVPAFPGDATDDQDKLNYYFTLSPEHVIGVFAAYRIKNDADEKKKIEDEMKLAKDSKEIPLSKDPKTGYGDNTKFTDEGIIKYYSEKVGGINHNFSKRETPKDDDGGKGKSWWSWENPAAIITGGFLIVGTGLILAGIVYWEKLAAWWDGPADAEGNGDSDEDDE